MRVLVAGGSGFVGRAAVRVLLAQGAEVRVLDPSPGTLPQGAEPIAGSIEDAALLQRLLSQDRPDAIACFAAFGHGTAGLGRGAELDPERAIAVNVLGFRRLLEEAHRAGVNRVVFTSSSVVYGAATSDARVSEDAPRAPLGLYALTKTMAEEVACYMRRRHGMQVVGLRIPLMLGPGLWYDGAASWVKRLVAAAAPGAAPELPVAAGAFDAMHVADLGRLVATLLEGPPAPEPLYNVAGFTTDAAAMAHSLGELVPFYAPRLRPEPPAVIFPLMNEALLRRDTGFALAHDLRGVMQDMLAERNEGLTR